MESAAMIKAAMARENDVVGVRFSPQPTVLMTKIHGCSATTKNLKP
jgi:hypothetical protein